MKIYPEKEQTASDFIRKCAWNACQNHYQSVDYGEMEYIVKVWYLNGYFRDMSEKDMKNVIEARMSHVHTKLSVYDYLYTHYPIYLKSILHFVSRKFSNPSKKNIVYYFGWILSYRIDWYLYYRCFGCRLFLREELLYCLDSYYLSRFSRELIDYEQIKLEFSFVEKG